MRKLLYYIFIIIVCSCSIKTEHKDANKNHLEKIINIENSYLKKLIKYNINGDIISEGFINSENNYDSIVRFFKRNKLSYEYNFKNGVIDGLAKWYYPNGKIKESVYIKDSLKHGQYRYYREDGSLERIKFYKEINDKEYLNNILCFNQKGDTIIEMSEFADLVLLRDTISMHEKLHYKFKIYLSKEFQIRGLFGDFDENFNILNPKSVKPISCNIENIAEPDSIGINYLRVIFQRKKIQGNDTIYAEHFLEKQYFVIQ